MAPVDNSQGHCLCVKEAKGGGLALQWVSPKLVSLRLPQVFLFPNLGLQPQPHGHWDLRVHPSSSSVAYHLEKKGGSVTWTTRGLAGPSRCPLVANAEGANGVSFVAAWGLDCVQAPCSRRLAEISPFHGHRIARRLLTGGSSDGLKPASVACESQQVF